MRPRVTGLLAVALTLGVAGCGGDPEPARPLPSSVATTTAATTVSPTTAAAPAPSVPLPADVKIVVDEVGSKPAGADAMLRDWETGQRAYVAAAAKADPRYPLLLRYQAGEAVFAAVDTINRKKQRNRSVIGTRRIYAVQVGKVSATQASVTWCLDDTKFFSRDRNTNKPIVVHGPSDYYRVSGTLQFDGKLKHWVLVRAAAQEGVQC